MGFDALYHIMMWYTKCVIMIVCGCKLLHFHWTQSSTQWRDEYLHVADVTFSTNGRFILAGNSSQLAKTDNLCKCLILSHYKFLDSTEFQKLHIMFELFLKTPFFLQIPVVFTNPIKPYHTRNKERYS